MSDPVSDKNQDSLESSQGDNKSFRISKKLIYALVFLALLIVMLVLAVFVGSHDAGAPSSKESAQTKKTKSTGSSQAENTLVSQCGDGQTAFRDKSLGAKFCYPSEWGTASVEDARFSPSDAGQQQKIAFSGTNLFTVGGTSEDWTTTIGRDGVCLAQTLSGRSLRITTDMCRLA